MRFVYSLRTEDILCPFLGCFYAVSSGMVPEHNAFLHCFQQLLFIHRLLIISSAKALALMAMMGTFPASDRFMDRILRVASQPFSFGIIMSMKITS